MNYKRKYVNHAIYSRSGYTQTRKFAGNVACMMVDSDAGEVILTYTDSVSNVDEKEEQEKNMGRPTRNTAEERRTGFSPLLVSATLLDLP